MVNSKFKKLKKYLDSRNEPKYRYVQITNAVFSKRISNFQKMTNLPKRLQKELMNEFGDLLTLEVIKKQRVKQTTKVLFQLNDKERVESVKMDYTSGKNSWKSICVSSQIGCKLKCSFCATGKIGFKRNLSTDEIIDQVLYFYLKGDDINSVSFMGMGEPLLNPATFDAIAIFTDRCLFNISQRKINISTVGIVPALEKLIGMFPQTNIAFSLHTPFEKQRMEMMPISRKYHIVDVFKVLDEHIITNKRKVFLVYMMLEGINDSKKHLERLIELVKERNKTSYLYHINLIRYNKAKGVKVEYEASTKTSYFKTELLKAGIHVTVRQPFGTQINAACGQLYANYKSK